MIFRPRSSKVGWLSGTLLIAILGLSLALIIGSAPVRGMLWIPTIGISALLCVALFFLGIYPTMTYVVGQGQLILRCGPFRWEIPARSIRSMVERDLKYMPTSEGWKLPGYTLFRIHYADVGTVRMCATALTKRILVVETDSEWWGVTPADVGSFIAAVEKEST